MFLCLFGKNNLKLQFLYFCATSSLALFYTFPQDLDQVDKKVRSSPNLLRVKLEDLDERFSYLGIYLSCSLVEVALIQKIADLIYKTPPNG